MNVLFVCTEQVARSPLAAAIFRQLVGSESVYVARSAGMARSAARRVTTRELAWADVVVVMEPKHLAGIRRHWPGHVQKACVLGVPDDYDPDDPELRRLLTGKLKSLLRQLESSVAETALARQ